MPDKKIELPELIQNFVDAVNGGETDRFLSFFGKEDGVVNDWGSRYVGHTAIRNWSDREFIGAKGIITPVKFEVKDGNTHLWAGWQSNFYTGDSKFIFIADGENIKEMQIVSS